MFNRYRHNRTNASIKWTHIQADRSESEKAKDVGLLRKVANALHLSSVDECDAIFDQRSGTWQITSNDTQDTHDISRITNEMKQIHPDATFQFIDHPTEHNRKQSRVFIPAWFDRTRLYTQTLCKISVVVLCILFYSLYTLYNRVFVELNVTNGIAVIYDTVTGVLVEQTNR